MSRTSRPAALLGLLALFATSALTAQETPEPPKTLAEALHRGDVKVSLRYRLETVDDDAFARSALASTLRTALSYGSAPWRGFSLFLEAENVTAILDDEDYNNAGRDGLGNGVTNRPVVADPEITEVNQAWLRYQVAGTTITAGRQEINLGDQRFVGAVGWRQNHQSFDAVRVQHRCEGPVEVDYTYVANVNRIFGDNQQMSSHLLYLPIHLGKQDTLTAYSFLLDYDRPANANLSTATYGLEWRGQHPIGTLPARFEAEYAHQQDHGNYPGNLDASYLHLLAGAGQDHLAATLEWEVLEGSRQDGQFNTPLATLHAFDGWADVFLRTPQDGLEALAFTLSGKAQAFTWQATAWDFHAESTSAHYGRELDLQLTYQTPWKQQFAVKAMAYDADEFFRDVTKLAFWTSYTF